MPLTPPISVYTVVPDIKVFERYLNPTLPEKIHVIHNHGNHYRGLAVPYNKAIDGSPSDLIMLTHPDMEFSRNFYRDLFNMIAHTKDWGAIGVVGSTFEERRCWGKFKKKPHLVQTLDSCMVVINRRHKIRFDPKTFDSWHLVVEDYCLAALAQGLKSYVIPTFAHHHSRTYAQGANKKWLLERNKIYLPRLKKKWAEIAPKITVV